MTEDIKKAVIHSALRTIIEDIRDGHEKGTKDYATANIVLMHSDLHDLADTLCDPMFTFDLSDKDAIELDNELSKILESMKTLADKYVKKEND